MKTYGTYVQGCNRAHRFGDVYTLAFGCPMVATFNVQMEKSILGAMPAKTMDLTWPGEQPKEVRFWLCALNGHLAWAMRWNGTKLPETRMEFISKRRLPEDLKDGLLEIEVFQRWTKAEILRWAANSYQWQGFPWLPKQRADSERVWACVAPHVEWSGLSVLDLGSHYGYHSFQASKAGAMVIAVEPNDGARTGGELIGRHIEMQDVRFEKSLRDLPALYDVVLYLSVQHQWDRGYTRLADKIKELKRHARRAVFVEVILPPLFGGKHTREQVDEMVGGEVLDTYKHKVRGERRIYLIRRDL